MKITSPIAPNEFLREIFGDDVNVEQVLPQESRPVVAEDLRAEPVKTVKVNGAALHADAVILREQGQFLLLGRYPNDDHSYDLVQVVSPEVFLKLLGLSTKGPMTASDMSNLLVQAFDQHLFDELGVEEPVTYAFRTQDQHIIQQHST